MIGGLFSPRNDNDLSASPKKPSAVLPDIISSEKKKNTGFVIEEGRMVVSGQIVSSIYE